MTYLIAFLVGVVAYAERFPSQETPEAAALEKRMNQNYSLYQNKYLNDSVWRQKVSELVAEEYNVQKGDTLWDISKVLFGEGFYWPQVWGSNPSLTNPHRIQVGDQIRFLTGEVNNTPQFMIAKGLPSEIEIPPPEKESLPVLKELPPSLPSLDLTPSGQYDTLGFAVEKVKRRRFKTKVNLDSYYAENYPRVSGVVQEMGQDRFSASQYDSLYVRMQSEARPGDTYTVIKKESRPLKSMNDYERRKVRGVVVEFQGEIRLRERVNERENIYRAEVTKLLVPVDKGSVLVKGKIPVVSLSTKGRNSRVQAQVVGGRYHRDRQVMGLGTTVYLNVGKTSGLKNGDIVSVIANDIKRKKKTDIRLGHRLVGRAQVVKVGRSLSTAIIVDSSSEISQGDVTL